MYKIIGLGGTNGSGKDTVGLMLAERHGYLFVSVTDILRDELRRRGLPVERKYLHELGNEWRRQSLSTLVDKAVEIFESSAGKYQGLVMASIRNPGEADRLHELSATLVWVDADPKVRYERIQSNAHARGRAGEDIKTFEQFLAEEQAEMHQSGDEATLNMAAVRDKADVVIANNASNIGQFKDEAETALKTYI